MTGGLLLLSLLCLAAGAALGPRLPGAWLALTLAGASAALGASAFVLYGGAAWEWRSAAVSTSELERYGTWCRTIFSSSLP